MIPYQRLKSQTMTQERFDQRRADFAKTVLRYNESLSIVVFAFVKTHGVVLLRGLAVRAESWVDEVGQ